MLSNLLYRICFICAVTTGLYSCSENSSSNQDSFTIVVIPDTQNSLSFRHQTSAGFAIDSVDIFLDQMRHIANQSIANGGDVAFVASVGDVWEHVTLEVDPAHEARGIGMAEPPRGLVATMISPEETLNFEIPKAIEGYQLISDAGIPFGVAPGNHDYDAWWYAPIPSTDGSASDVGQTSTGIHVGGLNNFRMAFGSDTDFFRNKDWYIDSYRGGGSSAQLFEAGGYKFLHFAFEMLAGDEVMEWAQGVVDRNPGIPTFISTHDYLNRQGERLPSNMNLALIDPTEHNSAEDLWQKFISQNDQIFMILSGHQPGQAVRIDSNIAGNKVYQILADYQIRGQAGLDAGQPVATNGRGVGRAIGIGDGWYRELAFHLGGSHPRIEVQTYSNHYESYSSELVTYSEWYREIEQPEMDDMEFLAADEFTIELEDFYERFGMPGN